MSLSRTYLSLLLLTSISLILLTACDPGREQLEDCNCDGISDDADEGECIDAPEHPANNCVDDLICRSDENWNCRDCRASGEEYSHYLTDWNMANDQGSLNVDWLCIAANANPENFTCSRDRTCGNLVCDFPCENNNNCASDCQWPLASTVEPTTEQNTSTTTGGGIRLGGDADATEPDAAQDACADHGGTRHIGDTCICPGIIDHVVICEDGTKTDSPTDRTCPPPDTCNETGSDSSSNSGGDDGSVECGCGLYGAPYGGLGCSDGTITECVEACGCKP